MRQFTLRGLDKNLEKELQDVAERRGVSLNEAALFLLREGARLNREATSARIGHRLDHLAGTWSEDEAAAFSKSLEIFETVDPSLW